MSLLKSTELHSHVPRIGDQDPYTWLRDNEIGLNAVAEQAWQLLTNRISQQHREGRYSKNRRILSEMQLCIEMSQLYALLTPRYRCIYINEGKVIVSRTRETVLHAESQTHHHVFSYEEETDTVIDFTEGQFVSPEESLRPGDRIAVLQSLNPSLIIPLSEQLFALIGTRQVILDTIGLDYRISR